MKKIILGCVLLSVFFSCKTVEDLQGKIDVNQELNEQELQQSEEELKDGYFVVEEFNVDEVKETVVYIDRPVYIPEDKASKTDLKKEIGYEAAKSSLEKSIVKPEHYKLGTFFYHYDENLVYEIYAQPYHFCEIVLEPGEIVLGNPLFSEDESVWELTANASNDMETGLQVQHLFLKPAYSKLDSSLRIITDRRVYRFRVKSFADTHMAIVKFKYPKKNNYWIRPQKEEDATENNFIRITNKELISDDYKIKYSKNRKPEFIPKYVYDDGQRTYIVLDEIVLQKKLPVLFNEKNEIINYTVNKNILYVPRLINKMTLRLGKEKVFIEKKKSESAVQE